MEGKFHDFNELKVSKICVGMKKAGQGFSTTKFTEIELQESSTLLGIFKTGNYKSTNIGRSNWLGLANNIALQPNCNKEGFNIYQGTTRTRLGIIGNNENECNSPDSEFGFGLGGVLCGASVSITCGSFVRCHTTLQTKSTVGYIFIRK